MIASETNAITIKVGTPTTYKKVKDINDSQTVDYTDWQDSADHDIGDSVPFLFSATLPDNYDDFTTYKMTFHDDECEGLTFQPGTVVVSVSGHVVKSGYTVVEIGLTDGCTFEVQIPDLKSVTFEDKFTADDIDSDCVVTVEYESILNEKAVLGSEGNPNQMRLEYSILNYANGEGTPTTDTEYTPWDRVIVFTYKTVVNKVDQDMNALAGATFTLYKWEIPVNEDGTAAGKGSWVALGAPTLTEDKTTFVFTGLDDGGYKLVETKAPDGFKAIDDILFSIQAEHDETADQPTLTALKAVDEKGNELVSDSLGGVVFASNTTDGSLTTTVVNTDGSALPETGGIGTTIFYTIGAVIALCAVVLLITKKRMKNQNS